jgi:hypothetical protein
MPRKYFVQDYYTETIEDFSPAAWLEYGNAKMGIDGTDVKLVGVRNWTLERDENGIRGIGKWYRPKSFAYGKGCKTNIQRGMKQGFVELRFSYTPISNWKFLPI